MPHELEKRYGLSAHDLLEAIGSRFRLRAALEGAVAEVHMEAIVSRLVGKVINRFEAHDLDGHPDFSIWVRGRKRPILAECKNIRSSSKKGGEAYREKGKIVAYKVETQKTRAATADRTSRYYDVTQFDILGVCLGKVTGDWTDFLFVRTADLARHATHRGKLAVMQRVPLADSGKLRPWYNDLGELLRDRYGR
jgi:hypothetical protein